jgi:intraflagellar transport protein 88
LLHSIKILNNIGVAFVKLGKYDEAGSTFEHCMEEKAQFSTGLNLILCAYTLDDRDKMKDAFQRLLDIPLDIDDDVDKEVIANTVRSSIRDRMNTAPEYANMDAC